MVRGACSPSRARTAGSAVIESSSTICHEILAEVCKISQDRNGQSLVLRVSPDIARALRHEERAVFRELKQALDKDIALRPDAQLHHEQFDLMAIGQGEFPSPVPLRRSFPDCRPLAVAVRRRRCCAPETGFRSVPFRPPRVYSLIRGVLCRWHKASELIPPTRTLGRKTRGKPRCSRFPCSLPARRFAVAQPRRGEVALAQAAPGRHVERAAVTGTSAWNPAVAANSSRTPVRKRSSATRSQRWSVIVAMVTSARSSIAARDDLITPVTPDTSGRTRTMIVPAVPGNISRLRWRKGPHATSWERASG